MGADGVFTMFDMRSFNCRDASLFFDFDGALAEITPTAEMARVLPGTAGFLRALQDLGSAVAIVSGRSLATIDELLAPELLSASAVHGCERRDARGFLHRERVPDPAEAAAHLQALCQGRPGLQCEVELGGSIAPCVS